MKHENWDEKAERLREKVKALILDEVTFTPEHVLEECHAKCESPIEHLMVDALCMAFYQREMCDHSPFIGPSQLRLGPPERCHQVDLLRFVGETNFIETQVEVGKYRADIIVRRWDHMAPETWLKTPPVVIECDGHDFHERTKEQAQRDKLRDRELQQEGYFVLRFTGSEIWRDAWGCAQQVNEFLDGKIRAAYSAS